MKTDHGLTTREPIKMGLIFLAIVIGTIIGWMTAKRVQMTKMPELGFDVQRNGWCVCCDDWFDGISSQCW